MSVVVIEPEDCSRCVRESNTSSDCCLGEFHSRSRFVRHAHGSPKSFHFTYGLPVLAPRWIASKQLSSAS